MLVLMGLKALNNDNPSQILIQTMNRHGLCDPFKSAWVLIDYYNGICQKISFMFLWMDEMYSLWVIVL